MFEHFTSIGKKQNKKKNKLIFKQFDANYLSRLIWHSFVPVKSLGEIIGVNTLLYIAENMPEYGFLIETHFSALAQNRRFYHYTGKHGSEKTRILYIWCSVMVLLSCQSTSEKTSNSHKAICVGWG